MKGGDVASDPMTFQDYLRLSLRKGSVWIRRRNGGA